MKYSEYIAENTEKGRVLIISDIHNCHKDWNGRKTKERMKLMCDALKKEYDKKPYDCILALGDYSLDFWKWDVGGSWLWNPPVSKTKEFMEEYCNTFPVKTYLIPGNHELYSNEQWCKITGFDREFYIVYKDYVFVMADTFAGDIDPKEHSDGIYSGINRELLKQALNSYPDKKIILFVHYFAPDRESEEVKKIIMAESRIKCIFAGHNHLSTTVFLDDTWRNIPVIFCGNFSYYPESEGETKNYFGKVFTSFIDEADGHWGYRILELNAGNLCTDYVHIK